MPITTPGQQGGKGGGGTLPTPDVTEHRYFKNLAGVFHDGQIQHAARIWFDSELVMNTPLATNLATTASNRYEAEDGVKAGGATVATQAECSNGRKVTGIGSGGSVTIHCDVTATATYEVAVGYTSTVERTFKISVNGSATVDLVCPASGGAGLVAVQTIRLALTNGANTIAFANASVVAPDLDYIAIAPALSFVDGVDTRSFTGITTPGRISPTDPDIAWPTSDEPPVFSDPTGGLAGNNQQTATLAKWGSPQIRIYLGSETQLPDPLIESIKGVGNASAYRGVAYIVIEGLQLQNGRIPNVTIEFVEGTRAASAIVTSLSEMVGLTANDLELSSLSGLILGDNTGFDAGSYTAITWTGLNNATQTGGGAIAKTSGSTGFWNAYAVQGTTISAGTDAAIRFTAGTGTFMIGFSTTATPGPTLPNPYAQVPFAIILNLNANPSQASKNALQMSLGGSANTTDIGVWALGDVFQVEIRNGRFMVYQNGQLLSGFIPPPATFPLHPIWIGYSTGGGPSAASYATGSNIGSEPIIRNAGALILDSQREASDLLEELMTRFQFILPEVDSKIKAVRLDAASDLTLSEAECQAYRGDGLPPKVEISRKNPLTFPKKTIVNYSDPQLDYHNNSQVETRLFGPQKGTLNVNLAMVDTGANMKKLAAILSSRAEVEGQTYKFTVGPKHKRVHQGTVLTVTEGSATHQVRVVNFRPDLPAGLGEIEAVRQSSVFDPSVVTTPVGTEDPIVPIPGNTAGVILDGPLFRAEDAGDGTQPVVYIAMCGRGSGDWPAGFFYKEFPANSADYILETVSTTPSGIGVVSGTALPFVDDIDIVDNTSSLVVNFLSNTELQSVTEAQIITDPELNLIAVANPVTGEVECVQFATATPGAPAAPYITKYTLSTFLRGRVDGNVPIHTSADDVVVIDSTIKPRRMPLTDIGRTLKFKFLTAGQFIDQVRVVEKLFLGRSLKPRENTGVIVYRDTKSGALANQIQLVIPTGDREVGDVVKHWVDVFSATAGPTLTVDVDTDVLTSSAHGLIAGDIIALSSSGTLPSPLSQRKHYYLRDITTNTFKLSRTVDGPSVNLLDTGAGTHKFTKRVRHIPVLNFGAFNPAIITIYTPDDTPPPDGEWLHSTTSGSGGWDSTITTEWTLRNDVVGDGPGAAGGGIDAAALALITEPGAEVEFTLGTVDYAPGIDTSVFLASPEFALNGSATVYREMRFNLFTDGSLPTSKAGSRRWKLTIHERIGGTLTLVYTDPDFELPGMRYRMQLSGTELRYYRDYGGPNSTLLYRSTVPLIFPMRLRAGVATEHRIENIKIGGLPECITTYPDTDMISDFGTQPNTVRFRVYEEKAFGGVTLFGDATDFIT